MESDRQHFVEDFGVLFEDFGGGRMVGRTLAFLMIAEPPEQSAEEIARALQASRGSVSQATRVLVQIGMVRRINRPGERRDYFEARPDAWTEATRRREAEIDRLIAMFERGHRLVESSGSERSRQQFTETLGFLTFWKGKFAEMFDQWQAEKERHVRNQRNPDQ